MITFSKVIDFLLSNKERTVKVQEFGVKTAIEISPFGLDSGPLKGMTAIYANTSNDSEQIIIGYINRNQVAKLGEIRLYATDSNGNEVGFIYLKDNGQINILGDSYSAVRFEPLKQAIDTKDQLINAELIKIQTAITALGGAYIPSNITTSLDTSKSDDIKLK